VKSSRRLLSGSRRAALGVLLAEDRNNNAQTTHPEAALRGQLTDATVALQTDTQRTASTHDAQFPLAATAARGIRRVAACVLYAAGPRRASTLCVHRCRASRLRAGVRFGDLAFGEQPAAAQHAGCRSSAEKTSPTCPGAGTTDPARLATLPPKGVRRCSGTGGTRFVDVP